MGEGRGVGVGFSSPPLPQCLLYSKSNQPNEFAIIVEAVQKVQSCLAFLLMFGFLIPAFSFWLNIRNSFLPYYVHYCFETKTNNNNNSNFISAYKLK